MPIRFGSDGFRGIIGGDFTHEAVTRIALAVAEYVAARGGGPVPIGFDTRFLSREMAGLAMAILQKCGVSASLAVQPEPSPHLSYRVKSSGAVLGVQVTASHNPYFYNGIKLKADYGGSASGEVVKDIEDAANRLDPRQIVIEGWRSYQPGSLGANLYIDELIEIAGHTAPAKVIVDHMHGATTEIYGAALVKAHQVLAVLRPEPDPLFGGSRPEPLEPLLAGLCEAVRSAGGGTIGLAFDGDGDRLAVIDENGRCLPSHEIFAILLEHLAQSGYPGKRVVTTVSFSSLLARIAAHYGLAVTEVPVGFKHVSAEMLAGDVLIGGEESGGAALGHYLPERDALLMALTVLAARQRAGKPLSAMVQDIYARYGQPHYVHIDVQLGTSEAARAFRDRLPQLLGLGAVSGDAVISTSDRDGVKLRTESGWVLVRASGTEPLARFYAEANSEEQARAHIKAAQEFLGLTR